jgi:ABC-type cobalt transport system substrate-binding protein
MDKFHMLLLALLLLMLVWFFMNSSKKSGYSDVQAKNPQDQCPPGYNMLGPVTCVKP